MGPTPSLQAQIEAFQKRSLTMGLAAAAPVVVGAVLSPEQFFRSYLLGYLFWLGVALGSAAILMLHNMTGGEWGFAIRRLLESAAQTLPLLFLLFIPLLFGLKHLYIWTDAERVAADEVLRHKIAYLNIPFFVVRYVCYFAVWIVLAHFLNKWSLEQDSSGDPAIIRRMQLVSGPGLLLYGATATFASVDWVMSLEPHWYSTIYGLLFIVGQGLAALGFMIPLLHHFSQHPPLSRFVSEKHFHDLGNLTLAFVMLWAYLSFSQYLIIWSGNLPEEIPWYIHRTQHGWQLVALFLILFHFAVPFFLLLSRRTKRSAQYLSVVALGILVMRLVDLFWIVVPSAQGTGFHFHWMDLLAPVALGGVWMFAFLQKVKAKPLLPLHDPRLEEALVRAEAHGG